MTAESEYFGSLTRLTREELGEAQQVPTPVGELCLICGQAISDGDAGLIVTAIDAQRESRRAPAHSECLLLGIIGHQFGVCNCTNYAGHGGNKRAAALDLALRQALRRVEGN